MIKDHGRVWLFFMYYWIIFGIATYFGQFLPPEWRPTLSMTIFIIIMISLFVRGFNRSGPVISHIYAILIGLVSYGTFEGFINQFDERIFYQVVLISVIVFVIFGITGYFLLKDISSWGRYLFAGLLVLILATIVNFFVGLDWLAFGITVFGLLLYIGYTMYDFNRMKNRKYRNARVMGFNLFMDLLLIIKRMLQLYRRFGNRR
ncbi:Bax inhibitor-1/YccA family protein [Salinicoccus halitifaciens]|nr:Bax inhibitor-1 family protein [Salinicoccus halitifaciens]MCD2138948.1 Bax inhibitor-1 family protein [Salinicoccus halitifaciens]